jgi:hypothetical protein
MSRANSPRSSTSAARGATPKGRAPIMYRMIAGLERQNYFFLPVFAFFFAAFFGLAIVMSPP